MHGQQWTIERLLLDIETRNQGMNDKIIIRTSKEPEKEENTILTM